MKGIEFGKVLSCDQIGQDIYRLTISTDIASCALPGQFVNLYTGDQAHLLPRPISICDASDGVLTLVFRVCGYGTNSFAKLNAGDSIRMMGPLGNGYPLDEIKKESSVLIIGGGLGIPPMLYLSKKCKAIGQNASTVLGFRDEGFLIDEFNSLDIPVHMASDSGVIGIRGTVLDCISHDDIKADIWMACGPLPMLRALKQYSMDNGIRLFVSLEERMACGVGACLGCVCRTEEIDSHMMVHNRRVCKDGPVFDAGEVVL